MENDVLTNTIKNLEQFKINQEEEINKNIITENGAEDFCNFIKYEVENSFISLFGKEHTVINENGENDNGVLSEFDYGEDVECKYAVMLSYWNYIKKEENGKAKTDDKRKILFIKGIGGQTLKPVTIFIFILIY